MAKFKVSALAVASALALMPGLGSAAPIYGSLGNFDVVNDTGKTAHGFEIDLEGISVSDVTDTFGGAGRGFPPTVERYGSPTISTTATGVSIVYRGTFSGSSWNVGTPSGAITTGGESCWTGGGLGYGPSTPCDHFGVGTSVTPTATTYKWLTETGVPGALTPTTATLPAPVMTIPTPPPPAVPPHVVAQVLAPPLEGGQLFGTAQWVKVFITEHDHPVALEDLLGNNGIVPQSPGETEVEWQLLQAGLNPELGNEGDAGANAESVLRRYEFYKYLGPFDQEGEALCEDPALCPGAVGAFIGDQNVALNLNGVFAGPPISPFPTPEPASFALLSLGLALLGFMRKWKS